MGFRINKISKNFLIFQRVNSDGSFPGVYHCHPAFEFYYIHSGKGLTIVDNIAYELKPNILCIFQPYQVHKNIIDDSSKYPFIASVFEFDALIVEKYLSGFPELHTFFNSISKNKLPSNVFTCDDKIGAIFDLTCKYCESLGSEKEEDNASAIIYLLSNLKHMFPKFKKNVPQCNLPKMKHIINAMEYIDNHLNEKFSLSKLASKVFLTPNYLSSIFHEVTGMSITDYLNLRRIHQASILLKTTSLSISEIAYRVGLNNTSHFIKTFKEKVGITPYQFKKQL